VCWSARRQACVLAMATTSYTRVAETSCWASISVGGWSWGEGFGEEDKPARLWPSPLATTKSSYSFEGDLGRSWRFLISNWSIDLGYPLVMFLGCQEILFVTGEGPIFSFRYYSLHHVRTRLSTIYWHFVCLVAFLYEIIDWWNLAIHGNINGFLYANQRHNRAMLGEN
jgi:hypothetical protein